MRVASLFLDARQPFRVALTPKGNAQLNPGPRVLTHEAIFPRFFFFAKAFQQVGHEVGIL